MTRVAKVLLPLQKLFPLDYLIPKDIISLKKGDLVIVPFRSKEITGIVWDFDCSNNSLRLLKYIKYKLLPIVSLDNSILLLIKQASEYYLADLGTVAKLVLPVEIYEKNWKTIVESEYVGTSSEEKVDVVLAAEESDLVCSIKPLNYISQYFSSRFNLPLLSQDQETVLKQIEDVEKPIVLKGVTGSGKTEIYFHLIAKHLLCGHQCLIMLPEISLTAQIVERFFSRFGFTPTVWNSSITVAKKKLALIGILTGKIKIVIGARSSLFLPYKNLKLIVVDEEHDTSYKQEDNILYNARDMAILRANISNIKILLCSATPSLETIYNINISKYHLIELKERYKNSPLPLVKIIDMRTQKPAYNKWLSAELISAIDRNLKNKEQTLLFLNRRGYSPLLLCQSCGHRFTCNHCTSWLVLHKAKHRLECHHCGAFTKIPTKCPECFKEDRIFPCGPGIERIAEEVNIIFPESKISIISKDETAKRGHIERLLHEMEQGRIDILIGTQIITKGYHFPNLTLVGVIDADLGINEIDLKATEKTFQLLYQVGGRAGRENKKGYLYLQTYHPDNIVFNTLVNHDITAFVNYELTNRKNLSMPPFKRMAALILTGKNEENLFNVAYQFVKIAPNAEIKILGPARSLLSKIANKYRYRILIIANKKFPLQSYLKIWIESAKIPISIKIKIDIDPISFN